MHSIHHKVGLFVDVDNLVLSIRGDGRVHVDDVQSLVDDIERRLGTSPAIRKAFVSPQMQRAGRAFARAGFDLALAGTLTAAGKNAADIRMTLACVDAVTLLGVDHLVVVSNDSDFTPLLVWARERGVDTAVVLNGNHSDTYARTADQSIVLGDETVFGASTPSPDAAPASNRSAYISRHPDFAGVVRRIDEAADFPWIDPDVYREAFRMTAGGLAHETPDQPWGLYKSVRDDLRDEGHDFSARQLNQLFRILAHLEALTAGVRPGELAEMVVGHLEGQVAASTRRLTLDESSVLARMLGFEGSRPLRLVG